MDSKLAPGVMDEETCIEDSRYHENKETVQIDGEYHNCRMAELGNKNP